jgi:ATP synthase protein I
MGNCEGYSINESVRGLDVEVTSFLGAGGWALVGAFPVRNYRRGAGKPPFLCGKAIGVIGFLRIIVGCASNAACQLGVISMMKIAHADDKTSSTDSVDVEQESDFKPLTAEQANAWRKKNPAVSPWRVIGFQVVVGALVSVLFGLISGSVYMALSAAYGALAVVVPAAVFARGMQRLLGRPAAAMVGFVIWELAKIGLTVAMLFIAPRVVADLNWLALLGGFVVTMKSVWVAMWLRPTRQLLVGKN